MYFKDRAEAGAKLAAELQKYRFENTAILALSEGGVVVAEQIAHVLHSTLSLMMTAPIQIRDYGGDAIGVLDQGGTFTYDQMIPAGIIEEIEQEMHTVLEEAKMQKYFEMSGALGEYGLVDRQLFYGRNVVVVSDGLRSGMAFEAAVNFLKPIRTAKIIAAVPIVSVVAVDRLHILSDEIHVLSVVENYLDTNHYYQANDIGDTHAILNSINEVVKRWV